jgi:hypothetical protein
VPATGVARKSTGAFAIHRNMNSACWQEMALRLGMPVIVALASWMVATSVVELGRPLPNVLGDFLATEALLSPLMVQSVEQTTDIEVGVRHATQMA